MDNAAATIKQAMNDLRAKRITPDEFRAVMRESKRANGAAAHERAGHVAVASTNR